MTSFHILSFAIFHTDLRSNTIVMCILTAQNHNMTNMQDCLLQLMQLIQYWDLSSLSTVITNNFIGEDVSLSHYSLNGNKTMGFVLLPSTQDQEQKIFTLSTIKTTPITVYDTPTMWVRYCDHIIPPNQSLKRLNKVGLHQTFCPTLIEFLCTDLDGNLSSTMNPYCVCKFSEYFLNLFRGLSEPKYNVQIFKKTIESGTFKKAFMDYKKDTAILGTMTPLSIFTNLFNKRFEKHSMLELTLEIMQHFYIKMTTEPSGYSIFPVDMAYYLFIEETSCQFLEYCLSETAVNSKIYS